MTQTNEWLDTYPNFYIHTNREIIANPEYTPTGWFNPFTEPEKLVEELRNFKTAKSIKQHIQEFYPGINPEYYEKKKIEENKQRDIKYCCTTWIWIFNPVKQRYDKKPRRCKHWNDCPICKQWKIDQHKKRLRDIGNKRIVIVKTEAEEKEIKAGKSQNDYLRILRRDGTIVIILNEEPQNDGEIITFQLVEELSEDMLPDEKRGRYSGKLGKDGPIIVEEDKGDKEELEVKAWMIRFTDESTIKDNQDLEKKVLAEIDSTDLPRNIDTLKLVTKRADEILEKVCIEHKVEKQFLYKETIYIDIKEVEWEWLENKLI